MAPAAPPISSWTAGTGATTYDNIRRDLHQMREKRKVALLVAIEEHDPRCLVRPPAFEHADEGSAAAQKARDVARSPTKVSFGPRGKARQEKDGKQKDASKTEEGRHSIKHAIQQERLAKARAKVRGETVSVEMEELQHAYAQFGHLRTSSGPVVKASADLWLHNIGSWGLTLGHRPSRCGDCGGTVPPGWRFTTCVDPGICWRDLPDVSRAGKGVRRKNIRGGAGGGGLGDSVERNRDARLYLCFHCTATFLEDHKTLASSCVGTDEFRETIHRARGRCVRLQEASLRLGDRPPSDAVVVMHPDPSMWLNPIESRKAARNKRHQGNQKQDKVCVDRKEAKKQQADEDFIAFLKSDLESGNPAVVPSQRLETPCLPRKPLLPRHVQMEIAQKYGTTVKDWASPAATPSQCGLRALDSDPDQWERDRRENEREERRRVREEAKQKERRENIDALFRGQHTIHNIA